MKGLPAADFDEASDFKLAETEEVSRLLVVVVGFLKRKSLTPAANVSLLSSQTWNWMVCSISKADGVCGIPLSMHDVLPLQESTTCIRRETSISPRLHCASQISYCQEHLLSD